MRPEDSRTIALCVETVVHRYSIPQTAQFHTWPPNRHSQGKSAPRLSQEALPFQPRRRIRIWAQPAQLDSSESTDLGTRTPLLSRHLNQRHKVSARSKPGGSSRRDTKVATDTRKKICNHFVEIIIRRRRPFSIVRPGRARRRGFQSVVASADGRPLDPLHPWNSGKKS
jgi:hypothetical protein